MSPTSQREYMMKIERLTQQRDKLLAALKDARDDIADWGAYASGYFQEKHRLSEDIKRIDDVIAEVEADK